MAAAFRVAAGIINPVTGRWMTKSWRIDDFAADAEQFYRELERTFKIQVYHPVPEIRFCLNREDAKRAQRRCRNPRYANVLEAFTPAGERPLALSDAYGSVAIRGAAYVDLPLVVETLRCQYMRQGYYRDQSFEPGELRRTEQGWSYQGSVYQKVIFCEGAALAQNPWFAHLPMTPVKGETLLCRDLSWKLPDALIHHAKWLLPYPDGSFRLGATYDAKDLDPSPSAAGARQLLDALDEMSLVPIRPDLLQHAAGIRPSTVDARPFLGPHPSQPGLFIFNGLGSKGASLAPTLSQELVESIFADKNLDPETDIRRFR